MSYQAEREQFIARMVREGLDLQAARTLLRCATAINRYAELACSSEAADRDRVPCPATDPRNTYKFTRPCLCDAHHHNGEPHERVPRIRVQEWRAERRAIKAVPEGWQVITEGDPRGYTLKVIPPSYTERNQGKDRHNLDAIGVPPRPSGIRW